MILKISLVERVGIIIILSVDIFLVDKKLEKFEHTEDLTLNFVTYDDQELDPVDIDNSEYMDLSDINKISKHKREEQFKEYLLTNDIYEKNRLIKKRISRDAFKIST